MNSIERWCELVENYNSKLNERNPKPNIFGLLEECAEEIENCYGRETELTIKVREFLENNKEEK